MCEGLLGDVYSFLVDFFLVHMPEVSTQGFVEKLNFDAGEESRAVACEVQRVVCMQRHLWHGTERTFDAVRGDCHATRVS